MHRKVAALCAAAALTAPVYVHAQSNEPAPAAGTPAPQGGAGGNPLARLLLMPDLSAIASFSGVWNDYDVERFSPERGELFARKGQPTFVFQEVELGLRSVVDPYFQADVFVAFTAEGAEVEEAYATTLSLPARLQLRAGKLFTPFGRLNQQHPHTWEFVDPPLARGRLLAQESLGGPGAVVSWLAPTPWFAQVELAAQSTSPWEDQPAEATGAVRLLQYVDLGDTVTAGLGLSAARRREGRPGAFRDLAAIDLHLRHRPAGSRSALTLQAELYLRKLRGGADPEATGGATPDGGALQRAWWAQASWRQGPRAGWGLRYEEAPTAGEAAPGTERRVGAVLNWYPTEFSRVALQGSWDRRPGGEDGVEALLHFEFAIGAHGAHPY